MIEVRYKAAIVRSLAAIGDYADQVWSNDDARFIRRTKGEVVGTLEYVRRELLAALTQENPECICARYETAWLDCPHHREARRHHQENPDE